MAKKVNAFGTLKVASRRAGDDLTLTFIDRDVMWEAAHEIRKAGFDVVDEWFGFEVFRDPKSALRAVEVFCT